MITRTGNGCLTRDVTVHHSLPQDGRHLLERRDRNADPAYLDPIVWQAYATAAAKHLVKGQAISFTGRFEPRDYATWPVVDFERLEVPPATSASAAG